MTVIGSNLDGGATRTACIFGSEAVSGTVRKEDSTVVCISPRSELSEVTVGLRQDGTLLEGGARFQYFEGPTVSGISPSRGPVSGGVVVSVRGANLRGEGLACRFGTTLVEGQGARLVTSTAVACIAPMYVGGDGKVSVELSINHGIDFSTDGKEFAYGPVSVVEGVRPSQVMGGEVGQVVTVVGRHFEEAPELKCRFGLSTTVRGHFMTSTMLTCLVPSKESGAVTVTIADAVTEGTALLSYAAHGAGTVSWRPTRGPLTGGTEVVIVVRELNLTQGEGIRCKFGDAIVDGQVIDDSTGRCWAPAAAGEGSVVVRLQRGSDGVYVRGAGVFEYMLTPTLFAVMPSRGPETGGRAVSVYGSGFKPGEVVCRFGSQVVSAFGASWQSSTLVTCVSPSSTQGQVAVEVSMNGGVDFTKSGI